MASRGVLVNLKRESNTCVSIWCSGKFIGWVSARNRKEVSIMAKAIMDWHHLDYDHDKFGALQEIVGGKQRLNELVKTGRL